MTDDTPPRSVWSRCLDIARGPAGGSPRSTPAYLLYAAHLVAVGAVALSNVALGLAAIVAPWSEMRRAFRAARPLLLAIAAYLLCLTGSILSSHDPGESLRAASDLFNFLVPVVALLVIRGSDQARLLSRALIAIGALIALQALLQFALGADHVDQRPAGPFSHYMTLGGFLVLVDCFLLAWIAHAGGWRRGWAWVAFGLLQSALLISYTRNAWVALAVILTLVAALEAPKLLVAWAPVAIVVMLLAPSPLLARFASIFDLDDPSNYDRLCMGYAGLHMIYDAPVFGQGPRMVRERYELYRHPTTPRLSVPHLHNSFLNLAAERGLTSLAALLALLVLPARRAWRQLRGLERGSTELALATLLVVVATLVSGMFEDYWSDTEIQRIVLFALALPYCARRDDPASGTPVTDRPSR